MTTNEKTFTPDDIITEILGNAEAYAQATEAFADTFKFYGRTLRQWSVDLSVEIPKHATPDNLKTLNLELLKKLQQCTALYARAHAMYTTLVDGSSHKKKELVTGLVQMYADTKGRRPGAPVIDSMAESYLGTGQARVAAKIVKDFFKEHRDMLIEARKMMEQLGFTMHLELKLGEYQ